MEIIVQQEYKIYETVRDVLWEYSSIREFENDNYKKATKSSNLSYFDGYKNVLAAGIYTNATVSSSFAAPGVVALLKDSFVYSNKAGLNYNRGEVQYADVLEMSIVAPNTTRKSLLGGLAGGLIGFFFRDGEKIVFTISSFDSMYILSKIGNLSTDTRFPFFLLSYASNRYVFVNKSR